MNSFLDMNQANSLEKAGDYSGACKIYFSTLRDKSQYQLHPQATFGLNNLRKKVHGKALLEIERSIEQHPKGYLFPMMVTDAMDGVRGVVAMEDIKADELILSIPIEEMITSIQGKRTAFGQAYTQSGLKIHNHKHIYILFAILDVVKENPEHIMANEQVYVESSTCLFWDQETIEKLTGSHLVTDINQFQKDTASDYDALCQAIPGFSAECSSHQFKKLIAEIISKNFGFEYKDEKYNAIVPIGDILNHSNEPNAVWSFNEKTGCYEEHALVDISAGETVCHTYHNHPANGDILVDYGFALEPSKNDYLFLKNGIYLFKTPTTKQFRAIWSDYVNAIMESAGCNMFVAHLHVVNHMHNEIVSRMRSYRHTLDQDIAWIKKNPDFSNEYFIRKTLIAEKTLLIEWYGICKDVMYSAQLPMSSRLMLIDSWSAVTKGPKLFLKEMWTPFLLEEKNILVLPKAENQQEVAS